MLLRRYRLSPRTRLVASAQERFLVCDHPLQWIRLNETAWQLLRALDGDGYLHERVRGVTPEAVDYLESLTERGVLKADYRLRWPEEWPPVRVIVPAYGDPHRLRNCLESLGRLDYPPERFAVTVVDDGSPEPLEQALVSDRGDWGDMGLGGRLRWQRLERNRGPADARNAAALAEPAAPAESADTLLAFVDSDCEVAPDWLRQLAAVLEEPSLAAAGGRVTGMGGHSLLARYEGACSSLDMGSRPGRVGVRGAPVPYLPSCNLAVRAGAFRRAGGFAAAWRTGEDVDFCWRLVAGGERLFYWPEAAVAHDHRERWGPFLARKRDYGRSEGPLGARHPARFAVGAPGWVFRGALIAAGAALWSGSGWAAGATLALPPAVEALRRLAALRRWPAGSGRPRWRAAAESMARSTAARMLHESRSTVRGWLAVAVPVCLALPVLLPLGGAVLALAALGEWLAKRPGISPWRFAVGYLAECLAYSLGRIEGRAAALAARLARRRGAAQGRPHAGTESANAALSTKPPR